MGVKGFRTPEGSIEKYDYKYLENTPTKLSDFKNDIFSTISISTMFASGWSDSVYSFESTYPVATYDIEVALDSTATSEQAEAFNVAQIVGSATSNVVKAYGIVPTVDIPIFIKAVMK